MKIILLIVLFPFIEITLFFLFLSEFGFIVSLIEILITFIIGCFIFSLNKKLFFESNFKNVNFLQINTFSIEKNKRFIFFVFGSIFLIIPGYISDIVGILIMFKFVHNNLLWFLFFRSKISNTNGNYTNDVKEEIIDGEFYDLHDIKKTYLKNKKM